MIVAGIVFLALGLVIGFFGFPRWFRSRTWGRLFACLLSSCCVLFGVSGLLVPFPGVGKVVSLLAAINFFLLLYYPLPFLFLLILLPVRKRSSLLKERDEHTST
jgi:hypothetical protein